MFNFFSFNTRIFLIFILSVAFLLRITNISNNPPAMYGDELTMVLDVNSILHTGFDTTGKFLPLNFTMGGGRPVGYGYFSIPFVAMFGTTALAVRMLSVLSGVGIVFLIYWLGKILFSKQIGLVASGILAVSPWDLSLSRGGFETHFALFLALLMVVLSLFTYKRPWFYAFAALAFGLSINTYSTYKFTLPVFLPFLLWFSKFKQNLINIKLKNYFIATGFILCLFLLLLVIQALFNSSESRFLSINIFSNPDIKYQVVQEINQQRDFFPAGDKLFKLLNNKIFGYLNLFGRNYINHLSAGFLFLDGDRNPVHNMAGSGSLYLVEIISILFGLGFLLRKGFTRQMAFLISWVLIAPIAASFISDPHALRSSFMLPPLCLLSAVGLFYLWILKEKLLIKLILIAVVIGFVTQLIFVFENLYLISPNKYNRFWAYPAKAATEIAIQNKDKYDYIFLSDRIDNIEFAYPAYTFIDPVTIFKQKRSQVSIGLYEFIKYQNIYIGPIPDSKAQSFLEGLKGKILYIGPVSDEKYLLGEYQNINGLDKQRALVVKKMIKY